MEMDKLVSLCKRRGFLFQSSEIYGGLQGFWDYGPLGVELKRNVKEAWWHNMVTGHDDLATLPGAPSPYEMVGLDCSIIMHPQVWKCSGHYDLFHDFMVDCRESKKRYRHDQVRGRWVEAKGRRVFVTVFTEGDEAQELEHKALKFFNLRAKNVEDLQWDGPVVSLATVTDLSQVLGAGRQGVGHADAAARVQLDVQDHRWGAGQRDRCRLSAAGDGSGHFRQLQERGGQLAGAHPFWHRPDRQELSQRDHAAQLHLSLAGIRADGDRVFLLSRPVGRVVSLLARRRYNWYLSLGLARERLRLREHDRDELSHYSRGTADIEYAFPFLPTGEFGELEGIAHRGDFDLRSHMEGKLVNQGNALVVEKNAEGTPNTGAAARICLTSTIREAKWSRKVLTAR